MGVRHVSGIKEWGGYQSASLITTLRDDRKLDAGDVSERLGLSVLEVNRRYRAFKTLQQMKQDEEFSDYARTDMYPLFHEAVASPDIRSWLGWDDTSLKFTNSEEVERFYRLIVPEESEGEKPDPKLKTYSDVRQLKTILSHQEARRLLFDPSRSFADALAAARRDEYARSWLAEVSEAITALGSISDVDLKELPEDQLVPLKKLSSFA
jgi:hypothetical protein